MGNILSHASLFKVHLTDSRQNGTLLINMTVIIIVFNRYFTSKSYFLIIRWKSNDCPTSLANLEWWPALTAWTRRRDTHTPFFFSFLISLLLCLSLKVLGNQRPEDTPKQSIVLRGCTEQERLSDPITNFRPIW